MLRINTGNAFWREKIWETINGKTKNAGNDKCQEKVWEMLK